MKQSWKSRGLLIIICIGIVLYIGLKRNTLLLNNEYGYETYPLVINEVMVNNRNSIRDADGDFEGWVEIYNNGEEAVNIRGFGLSNDSTQPFLWTSPDKIIKPKSFLIIWTSAKNINSSDAALHTNFKLKDKDKVVILTAPHTKWNNIFVLEPMGNNISYGRKPDGSSKLCGFDEGTPGEANISEVLIEGLSTKRLVEPTFSHDSGFYTQAFDLALKTDNINATIYYTLDGSDPTRESKQYIYPIPMPSKSNEATVVRARLYKDGYPKSEISTHSYFIEKNIFDTYNTPIISLVTDPKNLFDYEKGIYVTGKVFDQWKINHPSTATNQMTPANYNQKGKNWERETSLELFESDGTVGLVQNIGIRTNGGYSRASNIKPLALFARKDYDDRADFRYDFFGGKAKSCVDDKEINQFSHLLLRTSSTDSEYALFRDVFIQSLIQKPSIIDTQSSQPCIVYINGQYYGIHNIREAYDKDYISNYYHIDQDDVVILKNPGATAGVEIQEGYISDEMHYNRMITYLKEHNLEIQSSYDFINTQMDIDNYIEYNVLQIYCDNRDWPGNNVRIWRKRTRTYNPNASYGQDGRWRWMVFDLDYGFGLHKGKEAVEYNSLKRATEQCGSEWPNPPWSTLLLRSLLENEAFKNQFINVFADQLNTIFSAEVVLAKIRDMEALYYPNIKNHITRWDLHEKDIENWIDEIEVMKYFASERPNYVRQHIIDYFGLSGTATIRIEIDEGGCVRINSLNLENSDIPWEGIYFKDIPISIEAIPKPGFVFVCWEGIHQSQKKEDTITLSENSYLKAVFERNKVD